MMYPLSTCAIWLPTLCYKVVLYQQSSLFKARKGLKAYNQFVSGWVKDICNRKIAGKYLTTGRVSYIHIFYHC